MCRKHFTDARLHSDLECFTANDAAESSITTEYK